MIRGVLFPIIVCLAVMSTTLALDAAELNKVISQYSNLEHSTDLAWKSVLERLTFSLYAGAREAVEEVTQLRVEAARRQRLANFAALGCMIAVCVFFALRFWNRGAKYRTGSSFAADLITVSGVCLVAGILAPILLFQAHAQVPVLGQVILKFEAKSILTTITSLLQSKNFVVAVLVGLFSVVIPIAKMTIASAVIQNRWRRWHRQGVALLKAIGKWSMADVYVVSIFIAYFALSADDFSTAEVGLGLYFFAAYCVLSQIATSVLTRAVASTAHQ